MKKLYLDDCREKPDFTWDIVRNYDEFVAYIETNGVPDLISFDHDLGQQHYDVYQQTPYASASSKDAEEHYNKFTEKTGYDCAKWLIARGTLPIEYKVHSLNPAGADNIKFVMEAAYKHDQRGSEFYPNPTDDPECYK